MVTDHEFGHQADFADGRMSDELGISDLGFDYSAETVAQFTEGVYKYVALARIDSINEVLVVERKKNFEESDAGLVKDKITVGSSEMEVYIPSRASQPKLSKDYYDTDLHYAFYGSQQGESLTELIGKLRSDIIAKDEMILVNPKRLEPTTSSTKSASE